MIDEVESHLHPQWQRALLPALLQQLEELEGKPENHVTLNHVPWVNHGDINNWVTSNVFGLERGRSLPAERTIRAALAYMRGEPTDDDSLTTHAEIDARLRQVLAQEDDFWPHWITSNQEGAAQ